MNRQYYLPRETAAEILKDIALTGESTGWRRLPLRPCPTTSLEIKVEGWETARRAYLLVTACHRGDATALELLELLQLLK